MSQQRIKLQSLLNYAVIPENVLNVIEVNWFPVTYMIANFITNSINAWLTKNYRSSGMFIVISRSNIHFGGNGQKGTYPMVKKNTTWSCGMPLHPT